MAPESTWETACPKREDGQHCNHWYDDLPCCACGDDTKDDYALLTHESLERTAESVQPTSRFGWLFGMTNSDLRRAHERLHLATKEAENVFV